MVGAVAGVAAGVVAMNISDRSREEVVDA
jgi:hypothetical protein